MSTAVDAEGTVADRIAIEELFNRFAGTRSTVRSSRSSSISLPKVRSASSRPGIRGCS